MSLFMWVEQEEWESLRGEGWFYGYAHNFVTSKIVVFGGHWNMSKGIKGTKLWTLPHEFEGLICSNSTLHSLPPASWEPGRTHSLQVSPFDIRSPCDCEWRTPYVSLLFVPWSPRTDQVSLTLSLSFSLLSCICWLLQCLCNWMNFNRGSDR